nr:putative late blight resistance protein homolog R1A-4 isoform X2 [Ipomoea trifida]
MGRRFSTTSASGSPPNFGTADLFVEEEDELLRVEDLYVEKPQRDSDAEKTTQPCVKLGQVFQTAMEEIKAIKDELVKIKAEGRKTAHDVLQRTDLKDGKATGDHFPKLKYLSLSSCTELKEIPSGFAEIEELKSIQLADCLPSVVASAEEIKKEQLEYMNNTVDVVVMSQHGY